MLIGQADAQEQPSEGAAEDFLFGTIRDPLQRSDQLESRH